MTEPEYLIVGSLEKVFLDQRPTPLELHEPLGVFVGEPAAFQVAFRPAAGTGVRDVDAFRVEIDAASAGFVTVCSVEQVPVDLPAFDGHDDGYLRDTPGLYPDLLVPLAPETIVVPSLAGWRSLWFEFRVDDVAQSGTRAIGIRFLAEADGSVVFEAQVAVTVHPAELPPLDIVNTHWLHLDSLAEYYDVEVFGEEHWRILDRYVAAAAAMRVNSLLTPIWTPPLDTAVGGTRLRTQLVDIRDDGSGTYSFGFDRLDRWYELCRRHRIGTLEISHLFTQWGARATPAIYVDTPDGVEQRFGWHVAATDPSYRRFLEQLLPQLRVHLAANWSGQVIFHVSDEPHGDMHDAYRAARSVVDDLLEGARIVDALSDYGFASTGAVDIPIVATDAVQPFLDAGTSPLWVYYCVGQHRGVANRFIAQPSSRNRVLGRQIFVSGARGFLHWGFNFWASRFSRSPIDPFRDTSAGGAFLAGDPYAVYPGRDGEPWLSIRHRVFTQAMDDHRALQLLRDLTDQATASALVDESGALGYDRFTLDPDHYVESRRRVDAAILAALPASAPSFTPGS